MSLDPRGSAALALHRFGFGPRPGSIAAITSDPRGALLSELNQPPVRLTESHALLGSAEAARRSYDDLMERRMARIARQLQRDQERPMANPAGARMTAAPAANAAMMANAPTQLWRRIQLAEAKARSDSARSARIGFIERLVWFWSNHFCIAGKRVMIRAISGAYEREAIRPHVGGRFVDMLLAVESHPAMLLYLDNAKSVGPNSQRGVNRSRGLNENLAREILELHTLGVRTVYSQQDVTNFAKVITGWTVITPVESSEHGGEFEFRTEQHEPGPQTVIGKSYPDDGVEQGRAVLRDLARHPATARHIATKLATHFCSDAPPDALVRRLTKRFLDTDGDLKEIAKTLVISDEAWAAPRKKMKRPSEWIMGAVRAAEADDVDVGVLLQAQELLGEPLWRPPSPKGFSDQSSEWTAGVAERLDVAVHLAQRASTLKAPIDLVEQALGPLASANTRRAVGRAGDREQALALLFMSPEFQLR